MTLTLENLRRNVMGPPRLVVYGTPGIGKTSLAASAPNPAFVQTEDGLGDLDVPAFPKAKTFRDVVDALTALLEEDNDIETVVVDSLDALEPLLWQHVCDQAGKKSIEDFAYGKGYVAAAAEWRELLGLLDQLRDKGKLVLLLAHSTVVRFAAPDSEEYDRFQMRLDKRAEAVISDWADAVLFAHYETTTVKSQNSERRRGVGKGERYLHCAERPAYRAKNRYRMPERIPLEWPAVEAAISNNSNQ